MSAELINLTPENLAQEHLCCIIRTKKPHPGVEAKRQWLAARLKEGHVFRKLNEKATVFIEYAPLETAWVPIEGENFIYLYCLWACGPYKGKGYGRALMESCIAEKPASACWARQSKRPGFRTRPLQKNSGLQRWTPRRAAMSCLHFLSTAQHRTLPQAPKA